MRQSDMIIGINKTLLEDVEPTLTTVIHFDTPDNDVEEGVYFRYIASPSSLVELGLGKDGYSVKGTARFVIVAKHPTAVFKIMDGIEEILNFNTFNDIYFEESIVGGACHKNDVSELYENYVDYRVKKCN